MINHSRSSIKTAQEFINKCLNLFIFLATTLSFTIPYHPAAGRALPEMAATPTTSSLNLTEVKRVLVVSPHPDDETIAAGGLIQAALANSSQVKVVIVTNGDGQIFAPVIFSMKDGLTPNGYVAMGEQRQGESLAALDQLGVSPENIIFLGYPDRGIQAMLTRNWEENQPYTAPFTRESVSPYSDIYHPSTSYCGRNLLSDLETIVEDFQPDLIVMPHPDDEHTDHAATSSFTSLAVASLQEENPAYQPLVWVYVVHYGNYPYSETDDPSQGFIPPAELTGENMNWGSLGLSVDQEKNKADAIQDYPTQAFLLGKFLPEFARADEIFMVLANANTPAQTASD